MPEATNEQDKAFTGLISQQEAQYVPLSATPGQACANCRWFKAWGNYCHVVEEYPEPILATGHSNRWEAAPQPIVLEAEPIPVVIVEPGFAYDDSAEMALSVPKGLVERVKEFIAGLRPEPAEQPAFKVFKAANGRKAWISRHTGKWIDRENEILADASHDAYVARVQKGIVDPPELWMWHAKGTKHGQAVAVWKAGGFVMAAGYFDDTPAGNKAFEYYQKHSGKIKLSHMFHYPKETKIGGVYHEYNTIEITTLPDGAEAFPYTSFEEINTMALVDAARRMIAEGLGEDVLKQAELLNDKAVQDTKTLDGQGVASKGHDKYDGSPIVDAVQKMTDMETRLKTAESALAALAGLPETITQLNDTVKRLNDELADSRKAENTALEQINDLTKKLAAFEDLKPPASQSKDTLLNQRESALIDTLMTSAKSDDSLSLVEKALGVKPTIVQS